MDESNIESWITLENGTHVPILKGMSKEQSINSFLSNRVDEERQNIYEDLKQSSLVDLYDEEQMAVSDAYERLRESYDYDLPEEIIDKTNDWDYIRNEVISEKIENLNEDEIRNSSLTELLGKKSRRMSSYGDENMNKVIDKVEEVLNKDFSSIKKQLEDKGFEVTLSDSRISESKYLRVDDPETDESLSFRLSDHTSTGSGGYNDLEVEFVNQYGQDETIEHTLDRFKEGITDTIEGEWDKEVGRIR